MDKQDIRKSVRAQKVLLTDSAKRISAHNVFKHLESLDVFKNAENILIYNSLPDELSTREFIYRWYSRKSLFLPRVNGNDLEILPFEPNNIRTGAFQIEEPIGINIVDIHMIDLIIVPAVALDRNGNRVGRGKGYYDRLLIDSNSIKLGVCYDFQLFDCIDAESHDVPLDIVITPSEIIKI